MITLSSESGYFHELCMSSYVALQKYACVLQTNRKKKNRKLLGDIFTHLNDVNTLQSRFRSIPVSLPHPVSGIFASSSSHNCSASFKLDGLMSKYDHRFPFGLEQGHSSTVQCVLLNRSSLAVILPVRLWPLSCCCWEVIVQPSVNSGAAISAAEHFHSRMLQP